MFTCLDVQRNKRPVGHRNNIKLRYTVDRVKNMFLVHLTYNRFFVFCFLHVEY